jgi:hypothetical protein
VEAVQGVDEQVAVQACAVVVVDLAEAVGQEQIRPFCRAPACAAGSRRFGVFWCEQ